MATESLRGEVMSRWKDAGQPRWSVARTLAVAEQVDDALERRELNPAPRFREARSAGDKFYLKTWIGGCRFVWLDGCAQIRARRTEVPSSARQAAQGVNRRLTDVELRNANSLLDLVRSRIDELAANDQRLRFAYNRKIAKELSYDERGKPVHRIRLKAKKRKAQQELCANDRVPPHPLPEKGAVLDRLEAEGGYTEENTRLLCPTCDARLQAEKGYSD